MNQTPYKAIVEFFWSSKTKYSLHSPFVFDFFNEVMNKKIDSDELINEIEISRTLFRNDHSQIDFVEYGAGSKKKQGKTRKISAIAKSSLSGEWQCRLMYNLIKNYKPASILEIGTSLGISSAYLAAVDSSTKVITLEGNPSSAKLATELFNKHDLFNINVLIGEFSETLPEALQRMKKVGGAFIDGNHRKQATIDYFHQIRPFLEKNSFVIIDDIYWSEGMNQAWLEIRNHESVAFSIDVFRMGIVFFDHSIMPKQHFKLIDTKWKLWSFGLFG